MNTTQQNTKLMQGTFFSEIYNISTHVRRARRKVIETHIHLYEEEGEQNQSFERFISLQYFLISGCLSIKCVHVQCN